MKQKINYLLVFIIFILLLLIIYNYYNCPSNRNEGFTATSPGTIDQLYSRDSQDFHELGDNYTNYIDYYGGYPTGGSYGYSPINYYYGWPSYSHYPRGFRYKHKKKRYYY